ncbi:15994_t:CDS:2, partial [Entrophospora sp. SA101]
MLDCESTSFDDERKEKIFKLACAMGDTYDSENDREKEFENKLNSFLGYNIDGKDRKKRNCNEEVRFDALVKLEYSKSEKDALLVGFEYKNESSKVDPYVQISTYYQEYVVQHAEDDEDLILNTCIPCFLVCLHGARFEIAGAVFGERVTICPLIAENLVVRPDFFESWINRLTRIFCSLHEAIKTLEKYYSECLLVPEKKIDRNVGRFPWIRSYTKDSLVVSFQYKKCCVDILQSLVYLVEENDDTKHIVKFSETYGYDAHSFCAEHQIAPKIIHYSDINSGYKFIVMQYLDGYETINSLFSKVKKEDLKEIKNSIKLARLPEGTNCIIKFVKTYGDDVHELCYTNGFAPELFAINTINLSEYKLVVMEDLEEQGYKCVREIWRLLSLDDRETLKSKINRAIKNIHSAKYVHGDMRIDNIMAKMYKTEWSIKIVNFDWAGTLNEAKYPLSILDEKYTEYHEDAHYGSHIKHEHDLHLIE